MEAYGWLEAFKEFGIGTVIGFAVNTLARHYIPATLIKGDPLWIYYVSIFTQAVVFPPLALLSWQSRNFDILHWFGITPWNNLSTIYFDRAYLAAIWGYWAKDMFILSDPLIIIHHIACMSSLIVALSLRHIGGLGFIVAGTAILELGTITYNFNTLFPRNKPLRYIYWSTMTLSNIVACGLALWYFSFTEMPLPARLFYVTTVAGLSIGRQRELILNILGKS